MFLTQTSKAGQSLIVCNARHRQQKRNLILIIADQLRSDNAGIWSTTWNLKRNSKCNGQGNRNITSHGNIQRYGSLSVIIGDDSPDYIRTLA